MILSSPAVQMAFAIAKQAGGEGRLVGGLVRDVLLGRIPADHDRLDIDMSVNIPIASFRRAALDENIKIIDTGLEHGSVTLVHETQTIEVTQTRADLNTDGRHAEIGFTPSFLEDAKRRDFTINALYVSQDGTIHDPLDGMADITAKQLRFIGDVEARIVEDYLRILRYFRFIAALDGFACDKDEMAKMRRHFNGLSHLSPERIVTELQKLFTGANWQEAVRLMGEAGLDIALFSGDFLPPHQLQNDLETWQSRLASTLSDDMARHMLTHPLSRKDKAKITSVMQSFSEADYLILASDNWHHIAYFGDESFYERCLVQARFHDTHLDENRRQQIRNFEAPPCPVTGHDLIKAGYQAGPDLGEAMRRATDLFVKSNFTLSCDKIIKSL